MEPMALGSPQGSPASPYLPKFLMGDTQSPRNPISGRALVFSQSPNSTSPTNLQSTSQDFNRSTNLGQKTLFGYQQQQNFSGTPTTSGGPPTQGLFDSLREEQNKIQTPTRNYCNANSSVLGTSFANTTDYFNQSVNQSFNDSYLPPNNFNSSRYNRIASPITPGNYSQQLYQQNQCAPLQKYSDFWVTVYGFPESATSMIISHFSQCGTIIDKIFPQQGGNWVHLKFSSRLESDRALNFNEKILGNNVMIGVTHCKNVQLLEKENINENTDQKVSRVRPLSQVAYNSAKNDSYVVTSPNVPQRSSGIVNKAMDLLFGW